MIYSVTNDLLYNREVLARNLNRRYSEMQIGVAPYVYIPWPSCIYGSSDTIVLLWNYTKLLVALSGLWPRGGVMLLRNMVVVETVINILGGCQCLCYYVD